MPWASLVVNSQVPAFDKGFTEINTNVVVQPVSNLEVSVGHRYLNNNPFFQNSSLFVVGGYCRINDNWGFAVQEQYEATTHILEQQRYSIYRDLTSWVASLGAVVRDNANRAPKPNTHSSHHRAPIAVSGPLAPPTTAPLPALRF